MRYSEFMNFPIYIQTLKEVEVPVEEEEAEEAEETDAADDKAEEEGRDQLYMSYFVLPAQVLGIVLCTNKWMKCILADDGVADEAEETTETKPTTRKEKQLVWDLMNDNKAVWLRKPSDVTKEEYDKFYKAISKVKGQGERE